MATEREDERTAAGLREIIREVLTRYHVELGFPRRPSAWAGRLSKEAGVALGTARNLLGVDGKPARDTSQRTLVALSRFLATKVPELRGLTAEKLSGARTVAELLADLASRAELRAGLWFPRSGIGELAGDVAGIYVSYHHAFETGVLKNRVAREVVVITRDGDHLLLKMSYKFGSSDDGQRYKLFVGEALPLGESAMCVATSIGFHNPGVQWKPAYDRGRCLLLRASLDENTDQYAKFGILSSTRAEGGFEPCGACTILVRVQATIEDLDPFMQRVTTMRPFEEIIKGDFPGLSEFQYGTITEYLDNAPRKEDVQAAGQEMELVQLQDKVLKLWHDRFCRYMPSIINAVLNDKAAKVPFKDNWQESPTLAPDARGQGAAG